ncbi:MAG TPA: trigger factor [Polyangiaceae bacterium]|jgi:trigger factor|nr:trigger factor [Polyangiaceae bacterium]
MQVQVARISPVVLEVAVEVPAADVRVEVEKAYSTLQRKARVRGFRPGKAPRQVLAHLYGPQVASDVVNAIVNDTLPKVLSEQNVQPINQPQVEAGKFEQGANFSYKARFEVQPEIGEVTYEGLDLVRPPEVATEAAVDEQLELLRRQHARLQPPEPVRPAQKGDVVTIDFTLSVEGKELKDGGGEGLPLELGSGQILPELDAALLGKKIDDKFDVDAKFPDAHTSKELAGKVGMLRVHLKDVKERILPTLDDEFAKDVGNFQTLVELRADVHTRLEKMLKDRAESALAEQIVEKLNEKNPLDVPPSLVEQQCRMMEMELLQNARRAGQRVSPEDFAKVHGQVHADAEKKVRAGLLMGAIAKKLDVKVTDQDIQKGLEELAAETGKNVAKVRAEYNEPQRRQILVGMILEDKVLDVIEGKANIRAGEPLPAASDTGATAASSEKEAASAQATESTEKGR